MFTPYECFLSFSGTHNWEKIFGAPAKAEALHDESTYRECSFSVREDDGFYTVVKPWDFDPASVTSLYYSISSAETHDFAALEDCTLWDAFLRYEVLAGTAVQLPHVNLADCRASVAGVNRDVFRAHDFGSEDHDCSCVSIPEDCIQFSTVEWYWS